MTRRLATWISCSAALALSGCAITSPFDITYNPPAAGASLTVVGEQRTRTPLFVDVCVAGKWERAAMFGKGLVSTGVAILNDSLPGAADPKAVPLPDRIELRIPTGDDVQFRVLSNPELQGGMLSSCTVPLSVVSKPGGNYRAIWTRSEGRCEVALYEQGQRVTEPRRAAGASTQSAGRCS